MAGGVPRGFIINSTNGNLISYMLVASQATTPITLNITQFVYSATG